MELRHVRCAVAIADHGSFTGAASALHLSQPALSHAIAQLERELGSRLFDRSAAGVRPTTAGEAFLVPARRALAEIANTHIAVEAISGVLSGELRVATVRTAVVEAARLLVAFHDRHPGVTVSVEEPTDDRGVVESVRSGRCDVGLTHSTETPAELEALPAGSQRIVAVFPEAVAPRARTVTMEFLADVPLIAPLTGSSARARHDARFRSIAKKPNVVAECSDHSIAVELVRGGFGATLLSDSRVATVNCDGIAVREIRPGMDPELCAVRRPASSPAADALCAILREPG